MGNVKLSPRKSAAMCFIEQKLLAPVSDDGPDRPPTRERLYHGVSAEEEGRYEYLKRRKKHDVEKRYGSAPPTSTMAIGLKRPIGEYRASKHCHKPLVQTQFYRVGGAATHVNLPD